MSYWQYLSLFIKSFAFIGLISSCKIGSNIIITTPIDVPVPTQYSGEPYLFAHKNNVYLSWIEHLKDTTHALVFSKWKKGQWAKPITIAEGKNWFVNWADFPSLALFGDEKTMIAHWLQKSAKGTYDYDIQVSQSDDTGKTWQTPFLLNRDGIQAEHGFVSFEPLPNGNMFATWLDGRKTKVDKNTSNIHDHHGSMTLRSAIIDTKGTILEDIEIDEKVCDCCQTATAITNNGVLVAYRNRSEEEIRDIYILRQVKGQWLMPKPVFSDNWKINGCPVNGPAISANGKNVALAWFTAPDGQAQVKLAFSTNGGESFGKPIRIDTGNPLGRVDVILRNKSSALVTWLEEKGSLAALKMAIVQANGVKIHEKVLVTTGKNRKNGFPRIAQMGDTLIIVWTEIIGSKTVIRSKQLFLE